MAMARPPYALLAILLVRRRDDRPLSQWLRAPDGPLAPLLVALTALSWLLAVGALRQPSFAPFPGVDPAAQLAQLVRHPSSIFQIADGTAANDERVRISYEIIGSLGPLNILLSQWDYSTGWTAIFLVAVVGLLRRSEHAPRRCIVAWTVFLLSIGAVYGALYLTWTPVGTAFVSGVQGRYLLPFLVGMPLIIPSLIPGRWRVTQGPVLDWGAQIAGFIAWGLMLVVALHALAILNGVYHGVSFGAWVSRLAR
jgi:uncharacterized membrane protein